MKQNVYEKLVVSTPTEVTAIIGGVGLGKSALLTHLLQDCIQDTNAMGFLIGWKSNQLEGVVSEDKLNWINASTKQISGFNFDEFYENKSEEMNLSWYERENRAYVIAKICLNFLQDLSSRYAFKLSLKEQLLIEKAAFVIFLSPGQTLKDVFDFLRNKDIRCKYLATYQDFLNGGVRDGFNYMPTWSVDNSDELENRVMLRHLMICEELLMRNPLLSYRYQAPSMGMPTLQPRRINICENSYELSSEEYDIFSGFLMAKLQYLQGNPAHIATVNPAYSEQNCQIFIDEGTSLNVTLSRLGTFQASFKPLHYRIVATFLRPSCAPDWLRELLYNKTANCVLLGEMTPYHLDRFQRRLSKDAVEPLNPYEAYVGSFNDKLGYHFETLPLPKPIQV